MVTEGEEGLNSRQERRHHHIPFIMGILFWEQLLVCCLSAGLCGRWTIWGLENMLKNENPLNTQPHLGMVSPPS